MVDELSRFPSGNPSKRPISGMGTFGVFVRTIYFQDNVFRACLHKKHTVGHFSTFAGTSFCEGRGEVHVEGHPHIRGGRLKGEGGSLVAVRAPTGRTAGGDNNTSHTPGDP